MSPVFVLNPGPQANHTAACSVLDTEKEENEYLWSTHCSALRRGFYVYYWVLGKTFPPETEARTHGVATNWKAMLDMRV